MPESAGQLLAALRDGRRLAADEFERILREATADDWEFARAEANRLRRERYGDAVYVRGLVEFTNHCRNDCLYCGIRRSNAAVTRYRLTPEQILACQEQGYAAGFRTLVLQGGEDAFFTDERLCAIVAAAKARHGDMAVTLSLGERSRESYRRLREAGADRYLLRHETATEWHYAKLHPAEQRLATRLQCLADLQELGYQVGCGMMIGSPFQTTACLAADLAFIQDFRPQMVGLGPFLPQRDTPFAHESAGSLETTLRMLSLVRLILPDVLLPATTALATLDSRGRRLGILAGANVVMPNLSPPEIRPHYALYDNKASLGLEAAEGIRALEAELSAIGCHVSFARGDAPGTSF